MLLEISLWRRFLEKERKEKGADQVTRGEWSVDEVLAGENSGSLKSKITGLLLNCFFKINEVDVHNLKLSQEASRDVISLTVQDNYYSIII